MRGGHWWGEAIQEERSRAPWVIVVGLVLHQVLRWYGWVGEGRSAQHGQVHGVTTSVGCGFWMPISDLAQDGG